MTQRFDEAQGRGARYTFRPAVIPSIGAAVALGLLIALGVWQLNRAQEKRAMLEEFATRVQSPPVPLRLPIANTAAWRYRRVMLSGRFDARHQFLLDNQINRGRVGYHVLTPLELLSGRRKVLVDRGWVPLGASRELLPHIAVTTGRVNLEGTVYVPYGRAYSLGDMAGGETGWPLRVQFIDFEHMARRLGARLGAMIVRLDPKSAYGYRRQWQMAPMGPQRHLGYAVQWFALACALLVIYVVVNLKRVD